MKKDASYGGLTEPTNPVISLSGRSCVITMAIIALIALVIGAAIAGIVVYIITKPGKSFSNSVQTQPAFYPRGGGGTSSNIWYPGSARDTNLDLIRSKIL